MFGRVFRGTTARWAALAATAFAAVATVQLDCPAAADQEFGSGGRVFSVNHFDAIRGEQVIRTNPPTDSGVTFAHPFQAFANAAPSQFLAIGTYKGDEVSGTDCVANYQGTWSLYTDGETPGGDYFCDLEVADAFGIGSSPHFRIAHDRCANGDWGWSAYANGTRHACRGGYNEGLYGGAVALEVASIDPITRGYNLDVIHRDLELLHVLSNQWIPLDANREREDRDYKVDRPTDYRVVSRLGELN